MTDFAISWVLGHQQFFIGAATGYAIAHIPEAVYFAFHQAMKIPWLRVAVVKNPEQAKNILRLIESELEKDIDAEAVTKPAEPTK